MNMVENAKTKPIGLTCTIENKQMLVIINPTLSCFRLIRYNITDIPQQSPSTESLYIQEIG